MDHLRALIGIYLEDPCQVLPNALWKTLTILDRATPHYQVEEAIVTHYEIWDDQHLYLYWDRRGRLPAIPDDRLARLELVLVHQDYLLGIPLDRFSVRVPYFRLLHRGAGSPPAPLPAGIRIEAVDVDALADEVARFISHCYETIQVSEEQVRGWFEHRVFDADLWLWALDERGTRVGLGIAEVDRAISEGSLEWVQVLPAYRGRGIGRAIVQSLLKLLDRRVAFTTVSGEAGNPTGAESLYRRCGFQGDDVWWMLRA